MQSTAQLIHQAETRAGELKISIDVLCRRAGVHRATWQRWKAGTSSPTFRLWQRVTAVLTGEEADPAEAPAEEEETTETHRPPRLAEGMA